MSDAAIPAQSCARRRLPARANPARLAFAGVSKNVRQMQAPVPSAEILKALAGAGVFETVLANVKLKFGG